MKKYYIHKAFFFWGGGGGGLRRILGNYKQICGVFIVFVLAQAETFKYTNECLCFSMSSLHSSHVNCCWNFEDHGCRKDRKSSQDLPATNTFVELTGEFNSLKFYL